MNGSLLNLDSEILFGGLCISDHVAAESENPKDWNISVFPNPSSYDFTLTIGEQNFSNAEFILFNQFGKQVERKVLANNVSQVNFGEFISPGIYYLKVIVDHKIDYLKVMKIEK